MVVRTCSLIILSCIPLAIFAQTFTPVTGIAPVQELGAWRSVNWIDYDRDGDLDLYVTRGKRGGENNVLFRNEGPPAYTFTRMTSSIISQDNTPSDGSSWADYDNDSDVDCFAANWYGVNELLYSNNGNGSFTQIFTGPVVTSGGFSETGSWGDYNNDGLLDMYVANSGGTLKNFLFKNLGNGQFVRILSGLPVNDAEHSRGVSWVDYDEDGDFDLYITNENNENDALYRNMLIEEGVDTFQRVATGPLVTSGGSSWSSSWIDYDNDGDRDAFVVNQDGQNETLFRNDGAGLFTPITDNILVNDGGFSASSSWGDFDNDGDLDVVVTNAFGGAAKTNSYYRNQLIESGQPSFQKVTTGPLVTDLGFQYGVGSADFDDDGDLDIFIARTLNENQTNSFYRNNGNSNHWLTMDCRGTQSNVSAIGTIVYVSAMINGQPVRQRRDIEGQNGYCSQTLQLHFGLGDATTIDSLLIRWPSGHQEVFLNVATNRHLIVVEGDSSSPVLVSPPYGYLNQLPFFELRWNRSLYDPPYHLQIATDSLMTGDMVLDTILQSDTALQFFVRTNPITYYWRIQAARSIYQQWSMTRSIQNNVLPPSAPLLVSPAQGAVNVSPLVILRWRRTANTAGYRIQVSGDSTFSILLSDSNIVDTAFSPSGLQHLTSYYWRVRSENIGGGSSYTMRSFTTIIAVPEIPTLDHPSSGALDQPASLELGWLPATRASSYHVQVSDNSSFISLILNDSTLSETSLVVGPLGSRKTYFWRVRSRNEGGSSAFSPAATFSTILATPAPIVPENGALQQTSVVFRWTAIDDVERYHFQLALDSTFDSIVLEDSTLSDSFFVQENLQASQHYFWRVRAIHPLSKSNWTSLRSFTTSLSSYSFSSRQRWNLVALSPTVSDSRSNIVFPSAVTPGFMYEANTGYTAIETLAYGRGYWMKFPVNETISIVGGARFLDTINIDTGWNLIGSITGPVIVQTIVENPTGILISDFFTYDGGYLNVDTLLPLRGYWILASQTGEIILNGLAPPSIVKTNMILPENKTNLSALTITDGGNRTQTLYFQGREIKSDMTMMKWQLPPTPPGDVFDVRFSSGRMMEILTEQHSALIHLQGIQPPLKLSWQLNESDNEFELIADGKRSPINGKGSMILTETPSDIRLMKVADKQVPSKINLEQNYPNPFNPETEIRFQISEASRVNLKVYDVLGREVAILVNEVREPGEHTVRWNASSLPSGIYAYQLATGSVSQVKTMMLMK